MAKNVKTGGRKKGVPNKATAAKAAEIAESGVTPLEFMLNIMRGETPADADSVTKLAYATMRFEAAKAAAPYVHPKLAAIEHTGKGGGPIVIKMDDADLRA
jgi:hypothetical protein